jgi:xylan 1,4-beta-xylosidase
MRTVETLICTLLTAIVLAAAPLALAAQRQTTYANPVIPFDYPDPSVIRVGADFYAVATAGGWAPLYTIMKSRDLVNWDVAGSVFDRAPDWAADDFWAPELVEHRGRYFVYYTARKKNGPLCVAVASADTPLGPYRDHGPLVCQEIGSIDAATGVDSNGDLYLLWKEDGNSRDRPTPIYAQRLDDDGVTLRGERHELIRNDVPWEGGVVEGPFVLRRGDFFYLFYSGSSCCGRRCDYALGVARARSLLGPWEKNPANPILAANSTWRCPGHGSIVADRMGREYLLYHAYSASAGKFSLGRVALLDRIAWGANGWPSIASGRGPSVRASAPFATGNAGPMARNSVSDEFERAPLDLRWRWPLERQPSVTFDRGALVLSPSASASADRLGAILARSNVSGAYTATVRVDISQRVTGGATGLAAFAWFENALGISTCDGAVEVWQRRRGAASTLATAKVAPGTPAVLLRIVAAGRSYRFAFSRDGKRWTPLGPTVDGSFMDGSQLALTAGGAPGATGRFDSFAVRYQ